MKKDKKHKSPKSAGIFFVGARGERKKYPAWRYHVDGMAEPILVHNKQEDEAANQGGWRELDTPMTQVRYLMNWRFDLEDMTARQLAQFARDMFDIDLPVEAGREKLFKAIWKLHINVPENRKNIVLFAHSIKMNYDETQDQIRKAVEGVEPVLVEEFYA